MPGVCKQWTGLLDCTEHAQKWCIYIVHCVVWVGMGSHHADVHALIQFTSLYVVVARP